MLPRVGRVVKFVLVVIVIVTRVCGSAGVSMLQTYYLPLEMSCKTYVVTDMLLYFFN